MQFESGIFDSRIKRIPILHLNWCSIFEYKFSRPLLLPSDCHNSFAVSLQSLCQSVSFRDLLRLDQSFSFADAICRKSPSAITRLIRLFLRNFSCVSIPDISISTSDCNWFIFSFLADSLSRIPVKRSAAITGTAMHMVTRKSLTFRDIRSFNFGNSCKK